MVRNKKEREPSLVERQAAWELENPRHRGPRPTRLRGTKTAATEQTQPVAASPSQTVR